MFGILGLCFMFAAVFAYFEQRGPRAADRADVEAGREWLHAFLCACVYLWVS